MNKLLQALIKSGEINISLARVSAKGGFAILVVFLVMLVVLLG